MDAIIEWLWTVSHWHWWALAVILIGFEVLSPTTYLLWPGLSAGAMGFIVLGIPDMDWRLQLLLFAVLAVVTSVSWHLYLKRNPIQSEQPKLNVRAESYVGRRVELSETLSQGRGRTRVEDTWWRVESDDGSDIDSGVIVEVVGYDSATLKIRAVPNAGNE